MIRKNLIQWQWGDYPSKHQDRKNLILHLFAVPLFWAAIFLLIDGIRASSLSLCGVGIAFALVSLIIQGRGHKMEKEKPIPFTGAADFVSRFLVEQFINFPRYLITGGWVRAF